MWKNLRKIAVQRVEIIILILLLGTAIALFVAHFLNLERYIYFWDESNYYTLFTELGARFRQTPLKALDSINVSMRKADYNNTGVISLLPFYYLFGSSRLVYITAVAIVYALPTIVFFPFLIKKIAASLWSESRAENFLRIVLCVAIIALLPQIWYPVLAGYIDIVGLGVIFAVYYLTLNRDPANESYRRLIFIGLLVCLTVILRRWYAYWAVGFFVAMATATILNYLKSRQIASLKRELRSVFIIGAVAVGVFFALATQIAVRMIKTDYGDIYSAYHISSSIFENFRQMYEYFGAPFCLSIVGGAILMFADKKWRDSAIFLMLNFAVSFYLFTKTQDIGIQHYYWVLAIVTIFAAVFWLSIYERFSNLYLKIALIVIVTLYGAGNFAFSFFPSAEKTLQPASVLWSSSRLYPRQRDDFEQIHRLLIELDTLTRDTESKVYVLSSSVGLNSSIVSNGCFYFEPELQNLRKKIMQTHDVDKRDGFPFLLYEADYVVVSDPPGTHLPRAEDQRVVGVLAEKFLQGESIARAYDKLPFEVRLDNDQKVYIYRKNRRFTFAEIQEISDLFTGFYPNEKEKFAAPNKIFEQFGEK